MNIQAADYLVHFSNILLLVSYSVRDILWLRWFAVAAALTNIPYFLLPGDRALATGTALPRMVRVWFCYEFRRQGIVVYPLRVTRRPGLVSLSDGFRRVLV